LDEIGLVVYEEMSFKVKVYGRPDAGRTDAGRKAGELKNNNKPVVKFHNSLTSPSFNVVDFIPPSITVGAILDSTLSSQVILNKK
jgi:hypothetical protein